MLVGAVGHGHALHADGEARGVHHDEHGVQATVLLADQVAHGAAGVAELQRGGGAGLDAELMLDGHAVHVVALAQRAVGVDQELRHQEQRDALHALGRVGQAGQHQVDDVLGQIMLAVGDEDLGAGDAVAAVALRFGARAQQGQVRAGLRLGQVHGASPLAGDHRADVALAQLGRAGGQQRLDGAVGQQRTQRERQVGGIQHFRGGRAQQAGQALAAVFGGVVHALPAGLGVLAEGLLEAGRGGDGAIAPGAGLAVGGLVQRGQHLAGEVRGFLQHRLGGVGRGFLEAGQGRHGGQARQVVEHEQHVFDGGLVRHGVGTPGYVVVVGIRRTCWDRRRGRTGRWRWWRPRPRAVRISGSCRWRSWAARRSAPRAAP